MAREPKGQIRSHAERLRNRGQHLAADHLERQLTLHPVECASFLPLRETILTAVETIDPATETMLEALRVEVAKRLRLPNVSKDKH